MYILYLYQGVYINKILTKEDFTVVRNQQFNLLIIKNILALYTGIVTKAKRKAYVFNIGFIMYFILFTRLNIVFIISVIFCFSNNPRLVQIYSIKKLLQYICFIRNLAFWYYSDFGKLIRYYDANYVIDKFRRFILGYYFNISSGTISQRFYY